MQRYTAKYTEARTSLASPMRLHGSVVQIASTAKRRIELITKAAAALGTAGWSAARRFRLDADTGAAAAVAAAGCPELPP